MIPFLKQVAQHLYNSYGNSINEIAIVVPNRRSGVFFNAYLNECISKPIIGPEIISINELANSLSSLEVSDSMGQIFLLHKIYEEKTQHKESLDDFFYWGEILLNDFNDIDKYLLDAKDLFANIKDLKQIDTHFDYLSDSQIEAIKRFWGEEASKLTSKNRDQFLHFWSKLGDIYESFRAVLSENKQAYSGMLYRDVVENWDEKSTEILKAKKYAFIGFNALNTAEFQILNKFQKLDRGLFYWDYEPEFITDAENEAGLFIRRNRIRLPEPEDFKLKAGNREEQQISIISVPGQVSQTQVLNHPNFKLEEKHGNRFDEAAMILADESLLVPTVSTASAHCDNINITMGYPINNTLIYSFVNLLIELQRNYRPINGKPAFYHRPVVSLLSHQLLTSDFTKRTTQLIAKENRIYPETELFAKDKLLAKIFTKIDNWQDYSAYLLDIISTLARRIDYTEDELSLSREYLYQIYLEIQKLQESLEKYQRAEVSLSLYFRFLQQYMLRISIPFDGEPLSGLQVMGVLETRNLDFNRVYMFSVNEGRLPSSSPSNSFIPYNLRKAFGLPTYEEHDAVYAYYFYRMLNRAKEVVMIYNSSSSGVDTCEMSRYIYQLMYDSKRNTKFYHLDFDFKSTESTEIKIHSTKEHRQILLNKYKEKKLSPSALNSYIDCKLKFYFRYIAGIYQGDELDEEIDGRLFGLLFHKASEIIYGEFGDKSISAEMLDAMAKNISFISKAIYMAFAEEVFMNNISYDKLELSGKHKLTVKSLITYIRQMLWNDKAFAPFCVAGLETECLAPFSIISDGETHQINIGGTVDRIDKVENGYRVIDYKTGAETAMNFDEIDNLFDSSIKKRPKEIFQTSLYCEVLKRTTQHDGLYPNIYRIREFFKDFKPQITQQKEQVPYERYQDEFNDGLSNLLNDIFAANNVFTQTEDVKKCEYCDYTQICQRNS